MRDVRLLAAGAYDVTGLPSLVLIVQAVLRLECRQTDTQTDTVNLYCDWLCESQPVVWLAPREHSRCLSVMWLAIWAGRWCYWVCCELWLAVWTGACDLIGCIRRWADVCQQTEGDNLTAYRSSDNHTTPAMSSVAHSGSKCYRLLTVIGKMVYNDTGINNNNNN